MRLHRPIVVALVTLSALLSGGLAHAEGGERLMLYPDIHRDVVVFVHDGDIWRAPTAGGEARRLTSHEGVELFPKISPDGRWVAFSAEYSGARQVWVMPIEGGEPRQLTFYTDVGELPPRGGWDAWVLGWTTENEVLARLNRTPFGERMGRYFRVDPDGGLETPLPIPHGGTASFADDGSALAYTPIDREFRTWKRSFGGRAQDLWIYDLERSRSTRLTDYRGTDAFPMWHGDTIYFLSDRDYTLELFALDVPSPEERARVEIGDAAAESTVRQVTGGEADDAALGDSRDWDVLWPSQGPESIVFGRGGALYRLDLATEETSRLEITIRDDRAQAVPRFEDASDNVASATISPKGKRVVFDARGDLFSVPAEKGPTRNLTSTSGNRELSPAFSPDGRWLAYLSDASGEYEVWLRPVDGSSEPRQLTSGGTSWRWQPVWSPDSSKIALSSRTRELSIVDVASGAVTPVDRGFRGDLVQYVFSPDSRWLAFETVRDDTRMFGISLFSLDDSRLIPLGDGQAHDYDPAWSADGSHLFFLSDRDFNLRFSAFEFNYLYDNATRVYALALHPDVEPLFPPESDEVEVPSAEDDVEASKSGSDEMSKNGSKDDSPDSSKTGSKNEAGDTPTVRLELRDLEHRIVAFPNIAPGTYDALQAVDGAVFYLKMSGQGGAGALHRYDFESREESVVGPVAVGFELSASGDKILLRGPGGWHVIDAKTKDYDGRSGRLDLDRLRVKIDPEVEWRQIFDDAVRISRDFFYDADMHGMDWDAIAQRYRDLLPLVAHRSELDFLLGELIGELGAGHTYVQPGEVDTIERVGGGMLGAELEVAQDDARDGGRYRIARIFEGENWHETYRSPLTEPGVKVDEGDYLLAIDGVELTADDNPYRLLEGKADALVSLTVNDRPTMVGAREVTVRPLSSELDLRYIDWVKSRLRLVEELSDGRIGYIHLPNTAVDGNRMLQKMFYAQSNKEALIVDDRYNGGGFIPDRMIEYLERDRLASWSMRDIDAMRTPGFAHVGPKVMLMNGYSSSGGDALPYFFRQRGLGKLIGTRTWGGLIGLNGNPPFVDGGSVILPTFRIYDGEGNWVVENEGVAPDVEIFDVAEAVAEGRDPSIEAAVELLLQELEQNPVVEPPVPQPPDLSREAASREAASRGDGR